MKDDPKYPEPMVAPPETLADRMKRDLDAWTLAKAIIARAREPKAE